ncbi:alpha/beta superfamily hydrolase [Cyanobium sp. PCC 7001]|uniref:YheT family hydrolase n=1 Tax=Cyanobium sp. PCC 7001 TaxID=180281 RepID=UPI0001805330|nr:alpha/beta fold hydrolase [Cyanobium sp. PCC 7001]EDY38795.1 alpha/beta superfamily hydrolase [Cyanobium sp. PCC 7001]
MAHPLGAGPLLASLDLEPFQPRFPWLGADLQTLRDSLRPLALGPDRGIPHLFDLEAGERLMASLDPPRPAGSSQEAPPRAWVLVLHGLGGSSRRGGVRRLGQLLQQAGFAVLRLNLRGAGPGRPLARGTYAACCNRDLLPVLRQAAALAAPAPLLAVGLSLGGTVLLNAALAEPTLLAGLVCVSSPLDLAVSSAQIERPRNRLYQRWLLQRLMAETLHDPFGLDPHERRDLEGGNAPGSIRAFDAAITAPRWGYADVEHYYRQASPLSALRTRLQEGEGLPPTLLVHALDDPWVPAGPTLELAAAVASGGRSPGPGPLEVVLTRQGGHNGFHGRRDGTRGSWADRLGTAWLDRLTQRLVQG